jgi:hypothetical protein
MGSREFSSIISGLSISTRGRSAQLASGIKEAAVTALYRRRWKPTVTVKTDRYPKFTCSKCGMNVWGKPDVEVTCTKCQLPMEAEE